MWFAAASRQADSLLESRDCSRARSTLASSSLAADRLLDEVRSARLHGLNRHRHVAIAGDHDGRQPMARIAEPLQQFEPVHSGQVGIDQEACFAARTIGFEECLASRIILDGPAIFLEHGANRLAYVAVVVDDEDDGRLRTAGCLGRVRSVRMRRGLRYREETLDDLRQLLQLHRLVELHTVLTRDIAQGAGRDIAGQNDDRDLAMKLFPQLRGDLEPVHAVRQIVVGKDEVGPDRPARHQFQRCDAVRRRCRAMALVLEDELEEFAHFGIVLDDQDRASAANTFNYPVIYAAPMVFKLRCRSARWRA